MKKILLFFVALLATLGMNAQTTEIHNASGKVAAYLGADVNVKFGTSEEGPTIMVYKGSALQKTYTGSEYKVVSTPVEETFKAVYDTNGGVNTLTFYYDAVDHSGNGITVFQDGTDNYLFDNSKIAGARWGYNDVRGNVSKVVIDESVKKYSSLTSTAYMFKEMKNATSFSGAEYLNVANVTDMSDMFEQYGYLSTVLNTVPDVSKWNTGNVKNMSKMFYRYGSGSNVLNTVPDVSKWNTGNVTNMAYMFSSYGNNLSTSNVSCVLDLSRWNLTKLTSAYGVFADFKPKTFEVTIPGKTGDKVNDASHWYYGDGSKSITPPEGKSFTMFGTGSAAVKAEAGVNGNKVNWVQLWEGGLKFAEYNVGAKSVSDCGGYYAWGGSTDKSNDDRNTSASPLSGDNDTATKLWGGSWRMPTQAELLELTRNCDAVWTTEGGMNGWKFTGRGAYSSNSVFLPVDGYYNTTGNQVQKEAIYWSSTPSSNDYACPLWMSSYSKTVGTSNIKTCASVRAVYDDTKGTAKRTGNIDVNWVQLWKDGPKFAEYNVGAANNKAEDYGGYYCWGKAADKDSQGAYKDGTSALTGTDDTATYLWGSNWRMPTQTELKDLLANCTVEWTTVGGLKGRKFTGKGAFASNSVFLPAASYSHYGSVFDQDRYGYYWSSTPCGSDKAYFLYVSSGSQIVDNHDRSDGCSVRAVLDEPK